MRLEADGGFNMHGPREGLCPLEISPPTMIYDGLFSFFFFFFPLFPLFFLLKLNLYEYRLCTIDEMHNSSLCHRS